MQLNHITVSILNAMSSIGAVRKPLRQKFAYKPTGAYLILTTSRTNLTPEEIAHVDNARVDLIPRKYSKAFEAKQQYEIDYSRYTGEKLREIRSTGQKRECARRLARMNANGGTNAS